MLAQTIRLFDMNKQKILNAIKQAQADVELCRGTLNRMDDQSQDNIEYLRKTKRFNVDLAYRNGLVHALLLSGMCTDEDMEYLRSLPNKPAIWSGLIIRAEEG